LVAALLVGGAFAVVYVAQPTTCREGDMCSDNVLADLLIVLVGVVAAVVVLTVGKHRDLP
jgi:hypothetical protein